MHSPNVNKVILAAAGSRKTQQIVDSALAADGRVLITTFTNENQQIIRRRIAQQRGAIPPNIQVMGWFSFLINQCAKPYQRAITGMPLLINGLNFQGERPRYASKTELRYFLDSNNALYRDGVSDFVCDLNAATKGAVMRRLERVYDNILIDEVQDLVGYDLDVLDLLISCDVALTMVGDPRQYTYATNRLPKNHKYQGMGLLDWFKERADTCELEVRAESYRCNQEICDFADSIYPAMPVTKSVGVASTGHDGIFRVPMSEAVEYAIQHRPVVLRYNKTANTAGLAALNIGKSKGSTFDRVLLFPTKPMLAFLQRGDSSKLTAPASLYVAVTRARFSVGIVIPDP